MDQENNTTVTHPNFANNDDYVSKEDHHLCLVERFRPREDPTFTATIRRAENHYQCLKQQRAETNNKLQQKKVWYAINIKLIKHGHDFTYIIDLKCDYSSILRPTA